MPCNPSSFVLSSCLEDWTTLLHIKKLKIRVKITELGKPTCTLDKFNCLVFQTAIVPLSFYRSAIASLLRTVCLALLSFRSTVAKPDAT